MITLRMVGTHQHACVSHHASAQLLSVFEQKRLGRIMIHSPAHQGVIRLVKALFNLNPWNAVEDIQSLPSGFMLRFQPLLNQFCFLI
ncbi:hypothetical protein AO826_19950 [Xanthomonas phaseoli pv. manihotis]|nr:hypothetical protein AO826_19950 [Xanthomonas phaseoli pv. manihotis]